MGSASKTWAVILAAGDGSRLREITTTAKGEVIPKQFCSLQSGTCLLEDAIGRAQTVAIPQHIASVVAGQHRQWWSKALKNLTDQNIFVQPENRGTAHGVLFGLLQIERRAPDSIVLLLPADHYLRDEAAMARSLQVLRMPKCGWTDLGTPKRVEETVRSLPGMRAPVSATIGTGDAYLDLATSPRLTWVAHAS